MYGSSFAALTTTLLLAIASPVWAGSLRIAPISVEVRAPGAAATVNLRNEGATPLNAQIRVFRWTQVNGEEKLEPTDDVVASPPITALAPKLDHTVRIVRVSRRPLASGETYRLLVDELPEPSQRRNKTISLLVRYSIPVFFYSRDAAEAKVEWSLEQRDGRLYVSAANRGDRHVRISALKLRDANGTTLSFGNGLNGYVLGRSGRRWLAPGAPRQLGAGSSIAISAQGDYGPINASVSAQPAR